MPAGVSWSQYFRYTAAAMMSMFAGAQMVHMFYRPMDDFDLYVKEALEKEEAKKKLQKKTANEQISPSDSSSSKKNDTELDT